MEINIIKEGKEKELIIFHESIISSWLKDAWTFGTLVGVMLINYFLFNNNGVTTFFIIIFWFIWIMAKGEKASKSFYSKKSAIEYINKLT